MQFDDARGVVMWSGAEVEWWGDGVVEGCRVVMI